MTASHTTVLRLAALSTLALWAAASLAGGLEYPKARRGTEVDVYHGVEVADPYRWLEDSGSPETRAFIASQEALLESFLDQGRVQRIERRLEVLGETGTGYGVPIHAAGRYFYTAQAPQARHPVVHARRGRDGESEVVLDPEAVLADGRRFGGFSVSPDGAYLVYLSAETGSRWGELRIVDLKSGEALADKLDGATSTSSAWKADESGFFYVSFGRSEDLTRGAGEPSAEVRFHRVGTDAAKDETVFARPRAPGALFTLGRSSDGRFLIVASYRGSAASNRLFVADLGAPGAGPGHRTAPEFVELAGDGEHAFQFLGRRGDRFFLYTNHSAPNGRIVAVDRKDPRPERWVEVVPESAEVLAGGSSAGGNAMSMIGERLVLLYRRANLAVLRVHGLDGRLERELPLAAGWIGSGLVGDDAVPGEVWYSFNGFVEPSTVYRLDLETGDRRPFFRRRLPIDPRDFELEHVFYDSKDKTRVPLFVARKRGLPRDGKSPVFMYGYGFGGWVAVPWYQPHILAWLEMGGTFAMPGVRGGGEYGDAWRDAGIRLNRQNAVDDYIAAAEWLSENRYTSPGKVVANGWSTSGSLAAAAAAQRPDLFGAALIGIPSLDMLRYHLFTALPGWTRGFGSAADPREFRVLHGYSPYRRVVEAGAEQRCAPPTLVTVGEKDQVTPPLHGYKFIAALQHRRVPGARSKAPCDGPALLKVVRGAGHAFGATPEQTRQTFAEELTFLARVLDLGAE